MSPLVVVPLQTSAGRNPGDGAAVVPLPLVGTSLVGVPMAAQFWVIDAAAAGGLSNTAGVTAVIT